jgi:hypothetical protein
MESGMLFYVYVLGEYLIAQLLTMLLIQLKLLSAISLANILVATLAPVRRQSQRILSFV